MAAIATREKTAAAPSAPPLAPPARPSAQAQVTPPTTGQPGNTTSSSGSGSTSTAQRALMVILHGKRVEDELLRNALQELKQAGHKVTVRVTFDRGDVERFVAEAVSLNDAGAAQYETIVAGGGDGTLNEVVGALMQHREAIVRQGLSVALLPLGTANDFAATAGISVDPREALRLALDPSSIRPIDVATLNGRPFLNVAVAGGLAEVPADELSSKWKRLLGPVAIGFYVLKRLSSKKVLQPHAGATLRFWPTSSRSNRQQQQHTDSSAPDHQQQSQQQQQQQQVQEFQTDLLMLVAGNSRQMGRTVAVCPDALLDDGLLDFTLLSGTSLATQAAVLLSALASKDDDDSAADSGICQLRASRLELLAAGSSGSSDGSSGSSSDGDKIPVNRDGEPEPASHRLVFEVLHKALPMHLPDDRLLVSGQAAASSSSKDCAAPGFITGSIKHPTQDGFVPAASALPTAAAAGTSSPKQGPKGSRHSSGRSGGSRRHGKQGLTVKTLRRMLVVAGPEGAGVRRRAAVAAFGRSMALSLGTVLIGGVLGWVSGARAAQAQQQQQKVRAQQRAQLARLEQQQEAAAKSGSRARRHQRRADGRRRSEGVAVAAVV